MLRSPPETGPVLRCAHGTSYHCRGDRAACSAAPYVNMHVLHFSTHRRTTDPKERRHERHRCLARVVAQEPAHELRVQNHHPPVTLVCEGRRAIQPLQGAGAVETPHPG